MINNIDDYDLTTMMMTATMLLTITMTVDREDGMIMLVNDDDDDVGMFMWR